MTGWQPHPRHPNATPPTAPDTIYASIRQRLDQIDAAQGITTHQGAHIRRLTREIRQALHVIEAGRETA